MSTEIYYFSGTGNSLYVAKELQKRLIDTKLIPMVSLANRDLVETNSEIVGFVFPIQLMTVPIFVKDTIKKLNLGSAKYIFAIATRSGTPCGDSITKIEKLLKSKGKSLDAHLILNMPNNDPKFDNWHPATKDEIEKLESEVQTRLDSIHKSIISMEKYQGEDSEVLIPINPVLGYIGSSMAVLKGYSGEDFYADAKCNGCGTCEKVCLSRKVNVVEQKPDWRKESPCYSCYACINYCPMQAIQIKSKKYMKLYTDKNGRYHHPDATIDDILGQK